MLNTLFPWRSGNQARSAELAAAAYRGLSRVSDRRWHAAELPHVGKLGITTRLRLRICRVFGKSAKLLANDKENAGDGGTTDALLTLVIGAGELR
ncbi:MAG: hypothetical protein JOZ17_18850 [Acetobacteraceae bacterium]|nr:hypothetical protein [Acetobacteraceae bacterium]